MSNKIEIETKYSHGGYGDICLSTRNGKEIVTFGEHGSIQRKLKAKKGDKFLVTIKKLKQEK